MKVLVLHWQSPRLGIWHRKEIYLMHDVYNYIAKLEKIYNKQVLFRIRNEVIQCQGN